MTAITADYHLWTNAKIATMSLAFANPYGLLEDGCLVTQNDKIVWVGLRCDLPSDWKNSSLPTTDCAGALMTPGLIDCHTHLVYGGDRAHEFELRLQGHSYEQIAQAGGGIKSTVKETRAAELGDLKAQSLRRLVDLQAEGVTTVEIKSGYGLSFEHEAKTLMVARALGQENAIDVVTTFLGAHAVPAEFSGNTDAYLDAVLTMLPALHALNLVDHVDVFCEKIAFSVAQTRRVFEAARALGLPVKLHAEQLSDSGGAQLASEFNALSCDHLEWLSPEGARAMAASRNGAGTVAVLLPGAFYFLRETKIPPVALLREHKVAIAISTDCNPGSSPCTSILLMLNMACTFFKLTPEEALLGITRNAARALGLSDRGELVAGQIADFVLWGVQNPSQLSYAIGANPLLLAVKSGRPSIDNRSKGSN